MKFRSIQLRRLVLPLVLCTLSALAWAQQFELTRVTIDGGGGMRTADGNFELAGTIGQPDAGVLTGGPFTLTGGLWFGLAPGDCEEDGDVGLGDVVQVGPCMLGPGSLSSSQCRCLDLNRDDHVDLADVALIQAEFTGP